VIGLVTPYDNSETSHAAIRLAEAIMAAGAEVKILVLGKAAHLHPYWDTRLCSSSLDGHYPGVEKCTAFVHFQISPAVARKLLDHDAQHILMLPWHALREQDLPFLLCYNQLVSPSGILSSRLLQIPDLSVILGEIEDIRFDAGIPVTVRIGPIVTGCVKALFVADSGVIDFCGPGVLYAINELLSDLPWLQVTLLSSKSWSEQERRRIKMLHREFGPRFLHHRQGGILETTHKFRMHDWVVLPSARATFGIAAMRALQCGTPVIAYNIAPFDGVIRDHENGVLVDCASRQNKFGAVTAVSSGYGLLSMCQSAFGAPDLMTKLRSKPWNTNQTKDDFNTFWIRMLGLG
jgi:hypothetical protein